MVRGRRDEVEEVRVRPSGVVLGGEAVEGEGVGVVGGEDEDREGEGEGRRIGQPGGEGGDDDMGGGGVEGGGVGRG